MVRVGDEIRYPGGAPYAGGSSATPETSGSTTAPTPTPTAEPRVGLLMTDMLTWAFILAGGLAAVGIAALVVAAGEEHLGRL